MIELAKDRPELTNLIYCRATTDKTWRSQESVTGNIARPNPGHAGRISGSARFGVYVSFFHELSRRCCFAGTVQSPGRVHAMMVPGGIDGGGYRRPDAVSLVRQRVRELLKLEKD
ncbi:MAG: hypothetical protein OEV34_04730 [Gammaproteobacteria bacterium]|nr:hypothetical protein [Gammaproteobacteria bacterium]